MGLVSIALMPARTAIAAAEVVLAARELTAPDGPIRDLMERLPGGGRRRGDSD